MEELLKQRLVEFKKTRRNNKIVKFVFVGSGNVGKTSLVKVIKEKKSLFQFEKDDIEYYRTPFMEIETVMSTDLSNGQTETEFLLCDVAGQTDLPIHAFKELSDFVLGGVDLIILVFSNDNSQSFLDLDDWIIKVKDYYEARERELPAFLLLKNKSDMKSAVDPNFVQMMIENEKQIINYLEISCLNGENVEEFKQFIVNSFQ